MGWNRRLDVWRGGASRDLLHAGVSNSSGTVLLKQGGLTGTISVFETRTLVLAHTALALRNTTLDLRNTT